jgi:hypothetical protein
MGSYDGSASDWEITMAGEDELTRMFEAWRNDIDSEPFPEFTVGSRPETPRHQRSPRRGGWRRFSGLYFAMRTSGRAKSSRLYF